ncbi:DUF4168 domain-containing protein [Rhodospirillaceae bacterium SYSU D60014]|uniref:DUF4168 domain-containing protein n=1 Tax=Virgifigura deserti TaxID=2268457 RepID=UPI000E662A43
MTLRIAALSAGALLAGFLVIGAVPSIQAQTTETQPPATSAETAYSQQDLESFVAATEKVNEIGQKWSSQIEGAEDETTAMQLRSQANAEMAAAVQEEGLTPERYREIYQAAMADPELNNRLAQIYRDAQ